MSRVGLGEPVELPSWAAALMAPPLLSALAGLAVSAPWGVRLLALLPGLGLAAAVAWVSVRVASRSMQSVWISLAYALWFLFPVAWIVAVRAG